MRFFILRLMLAAAIIMIGAGSMNAQPGFMSPTYQFSKKKTSYITLKDGTQLTGNVKDFDRKKGVTDFIKLKATDGKTHKLDAKDIKHGYFHPSALSSFSSLFDDLKVQRWGKDLNEEMFKDGYVYLENTPVRIKKKTVELLMQLLNPHFSDGLRVYFDPLAKQTTSLGVGPLTVAGGNAKSYYVKRNGEEIAIRLKKKDYKEEFPAFFGDCDAVMNSGKVKWSDLAEHAYIYGTECAN
jgi:hypothetical protein